MSKIKLFAMLCSYNEQEKGNLERCLYHLSRFVDRIFVYDDGSTDNSKALYEKYNCHVLYARSNDFKGELGHKSQLLTLCQFHKADWVLIIDADEVISESGINGGIKKLCTDGDKLGVGLWHLRYWNIWRSSTWHRDDYLGQGIFPRLFKCGPDVRFKIGYGLHLDLSPQNIETGVVVANGDACVLHYGYSTKELIERRWLARTKLGVPKEIRIKGIQEEDMITRRIPKKFFPKELWVEDDPKPIPIKYDVE